jgi:hypothetical protein
MAIMATVELTKGQLRGSDRQRLGAGRLLGRMVRAVPVVRAGVRAGRAASRRHRLRKVDIEAQPELAGVFGIMSIPTLMVIRDKVILYAQPGTLAESTLEELIAKARAVDMDEVRRSLSEQAASA